MQLTVAVRVALMGLVFALVLSLALSPSADAQQPPLVPGNSVPLIAPTLAHGIALVKTTQSPR